MSEQRRIYNPDQNPMGVAYMTRVFMDSVPHIIFQEKDRTILQDKSEILREVFEEAKGKDIGVWYLTGEGYSYRIVESAAYMEIEILAATPLVGIVGSEKRYNTQISESLQADGAREYTYMYWLSGDFSSMNGENFLWSDQEILDAQLEEWCSNKFLPFDLAVGKYRVTHKHQDEVVLQVPLKAGDVQQVQLKVVDLSAEGNGFWVTVMKKEILDNPSRRTQQ